MKKIIAIAASIILLSSCLGGTQAPILNAPGLKGVGTLSLGMTTEEAVSAIKENNAPFKIEYDLRDEDYEWYLAASSETETPDYEEKTADYILGVFPESSTSSRISMLKMRLGFYKDTLAIIRIYGRWTSDGAETIKDAFKEKYGDGVIAGIEKTYGQKEVWRSEYVEAEYFCQDDHNKDWRKREILEYVEITPATRDIMKELSDYNKELYAKIAAKEEEQKQSVYDKI